MAELQVIYDPALEMAAIVDIDNRIGWGPAMVGPDAGTILEAFLDTTPFDLSETDTYTARRYYESFLERMAGAQATASGQTDNGQVVPPDDDGMGDNARAEAEAIAAGDPPPPPQPADTDPDAGTVQATQVAVCPNCNGEGEISYGDGSPPQVCGMCQGSKVVRIPAPVEQ